MRRGSFYSLVPQGVAPIRLGTQGKYEPVGRLSAADIQHVMKKKLGNQYHILQTLLQVCRLSEVHMYSLYIGRYYVYIGILTAFMRCSNAILKALGS